MNKVLIIDDDVQLSQLLSEYLIQNDLQTDVINSPLVALDDLKTKRYDLVLLDVMMPDIDGFELLKQLRQFSDVPVIMLTAKGDNYDKVLGLELGADDYLSKPFNHRELLARIKANTRRFDENGSVKRQTSITLGRIAIESATQVAKIDNTELDLTATEFQLLYLLMKNAGHMLSKERLCEVALGRRLSAYDRSLDMHISNVRKKMAELDLSNQIKTIRGSGYMFIAEVSE